MHTIKRYISNTLSLVNSLVIKINDIGIVKNIDIYKRTGISVGEDKTQWIYYQNLAGIKHKYNNDVKITLLENKQRVSLSVDMLKKYKLTHSMLLEYGEYYKQLINEYPDDIDYIKGCITPVNIYDAIEADDGTLLAYSSKYIEDNETNFIRTLSRTISNLFRRWYIRNYRITDELYLASFVANVYAALPAIVMKMRLDNVNTNMVNSFHLEHFFRSKYDIWDDINFLNKKSIIWLYNNIDYISRNIGKNNISKLIIDKLITPNKIGVGEYVLMNNEPYLDEDNKDKLDNSAYIKNDNYFKILPKNELYDVVEDKPLTIGEIIDTEINNDISIDKENNVDVAVSIKKYSEELLANGYIMNQETKLLDIDVGIIFKNYGLDITLFNLDHWLYYAVNDKYTTHIEFKDPNTAKIYILTALDGLYIFYYLLSRLLYDHDVGITSIKYSNVIDTGISVDDMITGLFNKDMYSKVAETIKDIMPESLSDSVDIDSYHKYVNELKDFIIKVWIIDSNYNNVIMSGNIKESVARMLIADTYIVPDNMTIEDKLKKLNIDITINDSYDIVKTLTSLYKTFTGTDLDNMFLFKDHRMKIMRLFNKLTSYSTQLTSDIDDEEPLYIPYTSTEAIYADKGLITIEDAEIVSPYETNYFYVTGKGDDFKDNVMTYQYSHKPKVMWLDTIEGIGYIDNVNNYVATMSVNNVAVEILNHTGDMYAPTTEATGNDQLHTTTNVAKTNDPTSVDESTLHGVTYIDDIDDYRGSADSNNTTVEITETSYELYSPTTEATGNDQLHTTTNVAKTNDPTSVDEDTLHGVAYIDDIDDYRGDSDTNNTAVEIVETSQDMYAPGTTASGNNQLDDSSIANRTNDPTSVDEDTIHGVTYIDDIDDYRGDSDTNNTVVEITETSHELYSPGTTASGNNQQDDSSIASKTNDPTSVDEDTIHGVAYIDDIDDYRGSSDSNNTAVEITETSYEDDDDDE